MTHPRIGIIGATGYTGAELSRLLLNHPAVELTLLTSESHAGGRLPDVHPQFKGLCELGLASLKDADFQALDLVFLALPHGVSMEFVKDHAGAPFKVIDLSGDFRLGSAEAYNQWYPTGHIYPEGFSEAVFGLPELFGKEVEQARLVANPGCYPTSAILPLAPLLRRELIEPKGIVVDSKSGVTGAGAKAKDATHFPSVHENFRAYGIGTHRHTPEIQGTLSLAAGTEVELLFTPHLLPINRGILTATYSKPRGQLSPEALREQITDFYKDAPFVLVQDTPPSVQDVRNSNYCRVFATVDERTNTVITISALDNLVKGAAGQAVQNMNLMLGFSETLALQDFPLAP